MSRHWRIRREREPNQPNLGATTNDRQIHLLFFFLFRPERKNTFLQNGKSICRWRHHLSFSHRFHFVYTIFIRHASHKFVIAWLSNIHKKKTLWEAEATRGKTGTGVLQQSGWMLYLVSLLGVFSAVSNLIQNVQLTEFVTKATNWLVWRKTIEPTRRVSWSEKK